VAKARLFYIPLGRKEYGTALGRREHAERLCKLGGAIYYIVTEQAVDWAESRRIKPFFIFAPSSLNITKTNNIKSAASAAAVT
jgi:hypothetical protein